MIIIDFHSFEQYFGVYASAFIAFVGIINQIGITAVLILLIKKLSKK